MMDNFYNISHNYDHTTMSENLKVELNVTHFHCELLNF